MVVRLSPAPATGITLTADAFAVAVNYLGELNLSASLTSETGKASKGQRIKFTDAYEDGSPVAGSFRNPIAKSDDNSTVKTVYSPGPVAPGTYAYITATILDEDGNDTGTSQTIKIYLKPE